MKNNILIILLLIAGLFSGFLMGYKSMSNSLDIAEQNLIAATDTINILKNKNGDLIYEKSVYIVKERELNDLLDISKAEKKELEKQLNSSLAYISKIESSIRTDTIRIETIVPVQWDKGKKFNFEYKDNWMDVAGDFVIDPAWNVTDFKFYNIRTPVTLTVGLTKDNKMFIESDNPYMNITDIEGAYVIENMNKVKHKPWISHGVHAGFGIQYGIGTHSFDFGPYFGYGLTYNF